MADITAASVKELRDRSGAGMMDCKKALTEANGDIEAATDWLRAKGLAAAQKKSSRTAAEGLVGVAVAGTKGVAVEVNSETDFVAKNEQFQDFVRTVSTIALESGVSDAEALLAASYPSGGTVSEKLVANIATIGENQNVRRVAHVSVNQGVVVPYVHNAAAPGLGKIGVLVALEGDAPADTMETLGKQIAMQLAGAAIGAANNVNNVADILSLLMLQTGAKMISDDGTSAAFERQIQTGGVVWNPGESALRFYTDFANPKSAAYTWNDGQTNSLDAFAGGKTAIIFDYAVTIPQIKERAPGLRLGTAAMPQLEGAAKSVNYADYWGYAVPAASRYPNEAWQFIFYASGKDINKYFSTAVGRLASRRDVIAEEQTDPNLGVFAEEILSAVSWYQADPAEIEAIFKEMINAVILKNTSPANAIADAASKVTFLMRK